MQRIWLGVVDAANRYIQETEPFKLAKTNLDECRNVLINLAEWLRVTAILIKPFLPRTAETFYQAFNFAEAKAWDAVNYSDTGSHASLAVIQVTAPITGGKPAPLFPKIDLRVAQSRGCDRTFGLLVGQRGPEQDGASGTNGNEIRASRSDVSFVPICFGQAATCGLPQDSGLEAAACSLPYRAAALSRAGLRRNSQIQPWFSDSAGSFERSSCISWLLSGSSF